MFPLILSLLLAHPGHDGHDKLPLLLPEEGMYNLHMRVVNNSFPASVDKDEIIYMPMDIHFNRTIDRWVIDIPGAHPMGVNDETGNITALWMEKCPDDKTIINYVYMDFQVDDEDFDHLWGWVMNFSSPSCDPHSGIYKQEFYMSATLSEPHSRTAHIRTDSESTQRTPHSEQ